MSNNVLAVINLIVTAFMTVVIVYMVVRMVDKVIIYSLLEKELVFETEEEMRRAGWIV
jgi:hypothetical protein